MATRPSAASDCCRHDLWWVRHKVQSALAGAMEWLTHR